MTDMKAYYAANRHKWIDRARREDVKRKRRDRDQLNRAALNEKNKKWRIDNPEQAKAIEHRRRAKRRPRKNAADREYRRANPEKCKATIARSRSKKPELYAAIAVKRQLVRRARVRALPIKNIDLDVIIERDLNICHICLHSVPGADRSLDHLIPVFRGGPVAMWNLMLAHRRCNNKRRIAQILPVETKQAAIDYLEQRNLEKRTNGHA